MSKVAWIGLGVMGFPMAGHLKTRGHHDVVVFNRTRAQGRRLGRASSAALPRRHPPTAARDADFVFTCVGNDDDLREVTLGPDGAFAALEPGAVFIDHTTASADDRPRAARRRQGSAARASSMRRSRAASLARRTARSRSWSAAMKTDFRKAEPVITAYARAVNLIGPSGSGQLTKMVNQICIGGLIEGLAEALHFAKRADLDIAEGDRHDLQGRGAVLADGESLEDHGRRQVRFRLRRRSGCARISRSCSRRRGGTAPSFPVTALVDQFYAEVQAMGGGRWDTSSLIARLRAEAR